MKLDELDWTYLGMIILTAIAVFHLTKEWEYLVITLSLPFWIALIKGVKE